MGSHRNNLKDKENTHLDLVPIVFSAIEQIKNRPWTKHVEKVPIERLKYSSTAERVPQS